MEVKNRRRGRCAMAAMLLAVLLCAGCGKENSSEDQPSSKDPARSSASEPRPVTRSTSPSMPEETTSSGTTTAEPASDETAELARAEVGQEEITNMMPAGGRRPDPPRPLPENPPKGIEVYPATTNNTVEGPIEYDRRPPTNGDHDPLWQNCGFYPEPIKDRNAVHSLDHGVVWITYRPDLPKTRVDELRSYGDEDYVIVSPYPGQSAPVIATSWRVQLELKSARDPRLRKFVDQFRISEISPLSGNKCIDGVGEPERP